MLIPRLILSSARGVIKTANNGQYEPYSLSGFGLNPTVTWRNAEDARRDARRFAMGRDVEELQRRFEDLLKSRQVSEDGPITFALDTLLPDFIRSRNQTYEGCSGPNCWATALAVTGGQRRAMRYLSSEALTEALLKGFEAVGSDDELKAGDVLAYLNDDGRLAHAAVHVTDTIVFTKNGFSGNSPYLLQARDAMEQNYFPSEDFHVVAFRAREGVDIEELWHEAPELPSFWRVYLSPSTWRALIIAGVTYLPDVVLEWGLGFYGSRWLPTSTRPVKQGLLLGGISYPTRRWIPLRSPEASYVI
ncbi:MAG: hypothetical protein COB53_06350 [Elusimicrobia bacterium]|nr:MAG: hypothetical protein COB53_06350 [Elusimicrobiota bacterium]